MIEDRKKYLYPKDVYQIEFDADWDEQKDVNVVDWARVRRVLEHEDWLIIERIKILLASQSLLSAAFYFLYNVSQKQHSFVIIFLLACISVMGMFLAYFISKGMRAARRHQNKVIEWWFSRFDYVKGDNIMPIHMSIQPPIAGRDPWVAEKRWSIPYSVIAVIFILLWLSSFIYVLFRVLSDNSNILIYGTQ